MPFKSELNKERYLYAEKPAVMQQNSQKILKAKVELLKRIVPKGYHKMPNGKLMKGAKHSK